MVCFTCLFLPVHFALLNTVLPPHSYPFIQAIEDCTGAFLHLVAACIAAEPQQLRAAAARLLARASGLGGGMGAFLVDPLAAALEAATLSATPAHDARLVLELLVPLVYRPALKAALLDSTAPTALARVVGEWGIYY